MLEEAEHRFLTDPTNDTAGEFMACLMEAEAEGTIDDDEWLDGLASIRNYLMGK